MADFITKVAKVIFPEKFKQAIKIESGSPDFIGARELINIFEFDIVKTREVLYENEITENPIEDGSKITDNIIKRPIQITFEGLISEASIGNSILSGLTRNLPIGSTFERKTLSEAYSILEGLRDNLTEVVLQIPKGGTYKRMYVKSLKINDDKDTNKSLKFNIVFQQVQFAYSFIDSVTINRISKAKPKSDKGTQASQESEKKVDEISLFRFVANRFENRVGNYTPIE